MKLPVAALPLIFLCSSTLASADEAAPPLPQNVSVEGTTLILNGHATRTAVDRKPIYTAALYLTNKSSDAVEIIESKQTKRSVVHFDRTITLATARRILLEDLVVNVDPDKLDRIHPQIVAFMKLAPAEGFQAGDRIYFDAIPDKGTVVRLNGEVIGEVDGYELYEAWLTQWIGPRPLDRNFKKAILGQ